MPRGKLDFQLFITVESMWFLFKFASFRKILNDIHFSLLSRDSNSMHELKQERADCNRFHLILMSLNRLQTTFHLG
ncbi:hypothetical protein EUGRSUZ_C03851 [Eucalyptus grandis]|uniref:Uncharacterized protein n=2 Tax=Eucalyptus grandis TaxID=71139 RepID=A0ACC3LKL6_EUCGR|nr:hypothetical protein EUGRSUZ_C03851 [Eucalyptus grandis]